MTFKVRLTDWDLEHLGCVPMSELTLPAPPTPRHLDAVQLGSALVLGNAALRRRSGGTLEVLLDVPVHNVVAGQVQGQFPALRRLRLAPGSLPNAGGASMAPFPPGAWPPGLRELDMPVPRHPFSVAAGLPRTLDTLILRCAAQDFVLGSQLVHADAAAEQPQAAAEEAAGAAAAGAGNGQAPAPRRWGHLAVHAGRTAGLDLDDLARLGGSCRRLTLCAPLVMLSTGDPAHPALLAAPPVRALGRSLAQYLSVLAPVLAEAGVEELNLVATETSFYCRRPGRLCLVDATALPPAGQLAAPATMGGYTASLAWPAEGGDAAAGVPQTARFRMQFVRAV